MGVMYRSILAIFAGALFTVVGIGIDEVASQEVRSRAPASIVDIDISPDNRFTARIFASGTLEVLDNETSQIVFRDPLDLQLYNARVDWSPDSQFLAAGIGTQVYVWESANWQLQQQLDAVGREVIAEMDGYTIVEGFDSLEWSPDRSLLFGETLSAYLYIWSTKDYSLQVNQNIGNNPAAMTWLSDSQRITTGNSVFDISSQTMTYGVRERSPEDLCCIVLPISISLSPSGRQIAVGDITGSAFIVDATTFEITALYPYLFGSEQVHSINAISWDTTGQVLSLVGSNMVQLLNLDSEVVEPLAQAEGELYAGDWGSTGEIAVGGVSAEPNMAIFGMSASTDDTASRESTTIQFETFDPLEQSAVISP